MGERPLLSGLAAHQEAGQYLDSPAAQFQLALLTAIQCAEMSLKFRLCILLTSVLPSDSAEEH